MTTLFHSSYSGIINNNQATAWFSSPRFPRIEPTPGSVEVENLCPVIVLFNEMPLLEAENLMAPLALTNESPFLELENFPAVPVTTNIISQE